MDFLFHFQLLYGVLSQSHSAETDLVESTTVQQLALAVRDNKKADFSQFSQFVQTVNRSCQDCPDHVAIHK
jgi:hypothetical protein